MTTKVGRPPIGKRNRKIPIAITLLPADIELLDAIADEARMTRSQLIRNILSQGLSDAAMLKKIGIFKAVGKARDFIGNTKVQMNLPVT